MRKPSTGFLDTTMLVRYLTGVPADLAIRAAQVIDQTDVLRVNSVALAETDFVLTTVYKVPRQTVVDSLMEFLHKKNITTYALDKSLVIQGLLMCKASTGVSFTDALIWAAARTAGDTVVYSFDESFPADGVTIQPKVEAR